MNRIARTVGDVATKLLFRSVTVTDVIDHGGDFSSVELGGDSLRGVAWRPGDKIQVHLDGFTTRTYTPTRWDGSGGSTKLLVFAHGDGPGARWVDELAGGRSCQFLGPRRSLRLDDFPEAPILVGDETSFGLALAWRSHQPQLEPPGELYEVSAPDAAGSVLHLHGISTAQLVPRTDGDSHVADVADLVADLVRAHPQAPLCLTGKAQTIARLRQTLKTHGLANRTTKVKAYWDENRSGLD
jgi:ferric-chelate reductase (NADPH)